MKVLSFALLLVLMSFASVGTASAQTFGTATDTFTSCGANCVIWQNTETFSVGLSGYQLTDVGCSSCLPSTADEFQLPQFSGAGAPAGSYLTQAVYDVDGYIEGNITLDNTNSSPYTFGGTTTSIIGVFASEAAANSGYNNANPVAGVEGGLGYNSLVISSGSQTVPANTTQVFPGIGYFTANGQLYSDSLTCGEVNTTCGTMTPYEGGGDFDLWLASYTNTVNSLRGGNGTVGGTTYLEDSGQIEYTFDYDVVTPPSGPTPEPVSMALLGSGLACLGLLKRKRFTR